MKINNPDLIFSKENLWDSYLKVEGELAKAQSQIGLITKKAAANIYKNAKYIKLIIKLCLLNQMS